MGFSAFYSHPHRRWCATKLEPAGSGKCEEALELEAIKVLKAIMPEAAEYVQGLQERALRLEIEPDLKSVEEYRTIMDDAWSSYVRGATWRGR